MIFLFGPGVPDSLTRFFSARADEDGHRVIAAQMGKYAGGEAFCLFPGFSPGDVRGAPAALFMSFADAGGYGASDSFTHMLLAGSILKSHQAGPLWAVVPYGPYSRQDRERNKVMGGTACETAARHLALDFAGFSAIDLHSVHAETALRTHFGEGAVFSLDPSALFAADVRAQTPSSPVVVSPDEGANERADRLARLLGAGRFYVTKERRNVTNTRITKTAGSVEGCDAIIVDDIADTFGTAANCIRLVHEQGAARVFFYAAHPVLSGDALETIDRLKQEGALDRVRFCNTIARPPEVEVLDAGEMLYRHVAETVAGHPAMQV